MRSRGAVGTSVLAGFGALWIAALAYGGWEVREYESTPGAVAETPPNWPVAARIPRKARAAQLLMFVHPECSCTRASLEELSAIIARMPAPVSAWIVIEDEQAISAENEALANAISRLPHVEATHDARGTEARLFGALTSGYTVLYSATGALQFSGGITAARGHVGANGGVEQLLAAAKHSERVPVTHAVYGCPL
jgi:hypothetical protein